VCDAIHPLPQGERGSEFAARPYHLTLIPSTGLRSSYGVAVDGWEIPTEFSMKPTALMLSTVANPKAGPESGEDASPRKTTDLSYVGPHEPGIRVSWSWLWP